MRFEIDDFHVDDLFLDEGNYRFTEAPDQKACVKSIYDINPKYFKDLMESVAKYDLGEPLLVYKNGENNTVLDGNRRLATLKVLANDGYAPTKRVAELAKQLCDDYEPNVETIQAQVSKDRQKIYQTVYERHSGSKSGVRRQNWNAYAAARFGFFENIGENKEWRILALLVKTEQENSELAEFSHDKKAFSFEVFRRLMREALRRRLISEEIFSERIRDVKKTAPKELLNDAINKTSSILEAMKNREISLSRSNEYADKAKVEEFFNSFSLSPQARREEAAKNNANTGGEQIGGEDSANENDEANNTSEDSGSESEEGENNKGGHGKENSKQSDNSSKNKICKSDGIIKKLNELGAVKLERLYDSLCTFNLNNHPELMYAGAWMFFEILAKQAGNIDPKTGERKQEFLAYFNSQKGNYGIKKREGQSISRALKEIQEIGNDTKHSHNATKMTAIQLQNDFEVLEPLILAALDEAIKQR